ncbi:MAG: hypothetical protein HY674_06770 [Chloroflexi bacterium]|nr:hypothetical protein [Chloroflexota bacterium]
MASSSLNANELRFLRALLRRKVRFMVVGLSAAALQGAPVVTQDVDLWFKDLSDPRIGGLCGRWTRRMSRLQS